MPQSARCSAQTPYRSHTPSSRQVWLCGHHNYARAPRTALLLKSGLNVQSPHYGEIRVPVVVVAGDSDKAVDHRGHAMRLHRDIPGSQLRILPNTGHMVHHVHPDAIIEAIETVFELADQRSRSETATPELSEQVVDMEAVDTPS